MVTATVTVTVMVTAMGTRWRQRASEEASPWPSSITTTFTSTSTSETRGLRRVTLIGMGVAGGLVPSPSALVVLLGAIALGRTVFGVLLVLAYGVGMAGTLTTVGYLVAKAPKRLGKIRGLAEHQVTARLAAIAPLITAVLVLIVGIGLAVRSAAPLL